MRIAICLVMTALVFSAPTTFAASPCSTDEPGYESIFDGKSLDGWQGSLDGYEAKDGILTCIKGRGGGLYTKAKYADFSFKFEFRLEPGANNGIALRYPGKGSGSYEGMECQVLDDTAEKYAKLKKWQFHGSIYGLIPAKPGALKPIGQWNSEEIILNGTKVKVILNGTTIVDADLADVKEPLDGQPHPGRFLKEGYLGFLGHGDKLEFRNLRVKTF
jgi:3-keto-disaccharide hydrolase